LHPAFPLIAIKNAAMDEGMERQVVLFLGRIGNAAQPQLKSIRAHSIHTHSMQADFIQPDFIQAVSIQIVSIQTGSSWLAARPDCAW
jgi:hypothetical protein